MDVLILRKHDLPHTCDSFKQTTRITVNPSRATKMRDHDDSSDDDHERDNMNLVRQDTQLTSDGLEESSSLNGGGYAVDTPKVYCRIPTWLCTLLCVAAAALIYHSVTGASSTTNDGESTPSTPSPAATTPPPLPPPATTTFVNAIETVVVPPTPTPSLPPPLVLPSPTPPTPPTPTTAIPPPTTIPTPPSPTLPSLPVCRLQPGELWTSLPGRWLVTPFSFASNTPPPPPAVSSGAGVYQPPQPSQGASPEANALAYSFATCPFTMMEYSCYLFDARRALNLTESFRRFEPQRCALTAFSPQAFVQCMRGRRLLFYGDSLHKQFFIDLSCRLAAMKMATPHAFIIDGDGT
jgi:hypothetical protein